MEPKLAPTDNLPVLYCSILLLVEELERCDARREAGRIRAQALAAYAGAWDERHLQKLTRLQDQLRRSIASHREPDHERSSLLWRTGRARPTGYSSADGTWARVRTRPGTG